MAEQYGVSHMPDVLTCLADLSNDEVFTPPDVANAMLDLLPEDIWRRRDVKFLDPCCKTGVFLREITKRLLRAQLPNFDEQMIEIEKKRQQHEELSEIEEAYLGLLQPVLNHILKNQVYGIAITQLTALMTRRTLYCAKYANSEFSVVEFDSPDGNIRYVPIDHEWEGKKGNEHCSFCGVSREQIESRISSETHAYEFIHTQSPERLFNVKSFDVIVGNPPYQLQVNETGKGLGAIPIYNKFVDQAINLKPSYLTMIIPARWFSGGVGLKTFRQDMLTGHHISQIVDFIDANECFPSADINGGVCYFLWTPDTYDECHFVGIDGGKRSESERKLDEFDIFIRRNEALALIKKVISKGETTLAAPGGVSVQTPYGLLSTFKGTSERQEDTDIKVFTSKGWCYARLNEITKSTDTLQQYKTIISKLSAEHAGNPDKAGMYRVMSRMDILTPGQACSQSYLTVCPSTSKLEAINCFNYLRTKFVRFLVLQTLVGMNISTANFAFVPRQDFTEEWTDEKLYKKYDITEEEQATINSMIKAMDKWVEDNE